jgi:hypothetical protein
MKGDAISSISVLLDRAEGSLAAHLAERPDSKHRLLGSIYSEIRCNAPRRKPYPTARDLFWDDPQSKVEEQCLNDALEVFRFMREHQ